jgi:hypothetical protein
MVPLRKGVKVGALLLMLLGAPTFFALVGPFFQPTAAGCGGTTPGGAPSEISQRPTSSAATILWAFARRGSPAALQTPAMAEYILSESAHNAIDDTFALAVWAAETQDGGRAIAGTNNIGNITTPDPSQGAALSATIIIRRYSSWQAGIAAWFDEIARLYVRGGHATDLTTFALYYVQGLTPSAATPAQLAAAQQYVATLRNIMATLRAHEASLHPSAGSAAETGSPPLAVPLSSQLPQHVSQGWATPDALQAASSLSLSACATSRGGSAGAATGTSLAVTALRYAGHLQPDGAGFFATWDAATPAGAVRQQGITWCTDFVATVVAASTGHPLSGYPDAQSWLSGWTHPGLVAVAPARGSGRCRGMWWS